MKKIIKKLIAIILFPAVLIIFILMKYFNFRVGILDFSRIGHSTSFAANYLIQKKKLKTKYIDFIFSSKKNVNDFIKKKISKKIFLINNLSIVYRTIQYTFKFWFSSRCYRKVNFNINSLNKIPQNDKLFNFNKDEKNYLISELRKIGLKISDKWICIHNRDQSYLNKIYPNTDWYYHNYRNFSVNDLNPVIKKMIAHGNFVIRMGNIVSEKINFKNKKLIDYHLIKNKSELLEIYLLTNAKLYFGSDSGIFNVSMVNKVPFCFINFPSATNMLKYYSWSKIPFIFKIMKNKESNQILSLGNILENKLDTIFSSNEFEKKKIIMINNSPEDIIDLYSEVNNILNNNCEYDSEDKYLQKKFWKIYSKYNKIPKLSSQTPLVGSKFLKKYNYILE